MCVCVCVCVSGGGGGIDLCVWCEQCVYMHSIGDVFVNTSCHSVLCVSVCVCMYVYTCS